MYPPSSIRADFVLPPRSGQCTVLVTGAASASQDLRLCANQTVDASKANQKKKGLPGAVIEFVFIGKDGYANFTTAAGTMDSTATGVNAANAGPIFKDGVHYTAQLEELVDNFINFQTPGGAATLCIWQRSPY